jgi:hypothetical protein
MRGGLKLDRERVVFPDDPTYDAEYESCVAMLRAHSIPIRYATHQEIRNGHPIDGVPIGR